MSFKFAKTLLMGSVFAMGAFGLVACGDDSSSSKADEEGESTPISVSSQQDASITFTGLNVVSAGTSVKLTGSIGLNFTDTLSSATPENLYFTSLSIQIGKVQADGSVTSVAAQPVIQVQPTIPTQGNISLTEAGILLDLTSSALTECGDYAFIVAVEATDGTKTFSNTQKINFTRQADLYCKAVEASSSSAAPVAEIAMTACPEITLSTELAPGLDLATCTATASTTADIVIVKSKSTGGNDYSITSGNGTLFSPISNGNDYDATYWPTPAYVSSFKYNTITGTSIENLMENYASEIYVAKTAAFNEATGAGFYAFGITKASEGNNGNFTVKMTVYKAQ